MFYNRDQSLLISEEQAATVRNALRIEDGGGGGGGGGGGATTIKHDTQIIRQDFFSYVRKVVRNTHVALTRQENFWSDRRRTVVRNTQVLVSRQENFWIHRAQGIGDVAG